MSDRGVVLINVLILLLIMVFVAGGMLQLAMGRAQMVARHRSSAAAQQMVQSVRAVIETCLVNVDMVQAASCAPTPAACTFGATTIHWWCIPLGGSSQVGANFNITGGNGVVYNFGVDFYPSSAASGPTLMTIQCNNCE